MKNEEILDALPIKFYLIDLHDKTIVQTNDPAVQPGQKACFLQIVNEKRSCRSMQNTCFCERVEKEDEFGCIVESGERGNRLYHKAHVKKTGANYALATLTNISREMHSEREIKINNIRLQRAENLASFGSWEIDLRTGTMNATEGARRIYGVDTPIMSLQEVKNIPLPEYRDALDRELEDLLAGKKSYNIRFRIKRPNDGQIRYIHSIAEFREDKKMVFGVINDITEMVRFESALHDSLTDLKLAQDIARIGNWKFDPERRKLIISGQVNEILEGFEIPEQPSVKDFEKLTGPEHFGLFEKSIWKAVLYGRPFENQYKLQLKNGIVKWIEMICRPDKEKSTAGHILRGTIQDITHTKEAENALQHSNNLFRTLVHNLPDAIYMKDVNGRKIIANEGDARNCGMEQVEQVLGKTDYEIYPAEIARQYAEDDLLVLKQGQCVINREEELPGEPKRWILTTKVPLKDEQGNISGLVGIGHDITHRRNMEEELKAAKMKAEESDRLKSVFLANMSHEIRTPLNGILGFSNFICSSKVEPGQLEYYSRIIDNCGRRLATLIDDIIDISLIQTNQLKLSFTHFNLSELLQELFTFYRNLKKEQLLNIDFRMNNLLMDESVVFCSDKQRIYQIFKNLLDNAFKFTQTGYIEYGCSLSGKGELILFVEDTGIGIEESKQEIIFENFRQVEEGLSRQYEGAGLGLPIVSGIVKQLGGSIKVSSTPDQGTAFYISVPAHSEAAREITTEKYEPSPQVALKKGTVKKLIVSFEDDPASIEYLRSVAHLLGCTLVNFDNPRQGIEYVRNHKADLIFMDVRLPEMTGFEVTQILKSEFPDLPVIIQTAYAMKEDREKAFSAGCDDYLAKPVPLKDLRGKIRQFIGEKN